MATILGLDIDPSTVRGVVLKTALSKGQVASYVSAPLAPSSTPEEQAESLRAAVRQVLAAVGHPLDRVYTELSGDEVSIRKVSIPVKVAKKADELLPNELEGLIPFEADESVFAHQVVETVGAELKLLAAVAPKESVRKHLDELRVLGVEPREVAVGAVALDGLVPLVPALASSGPQCLIDIHPEGTDLCVLVNGACHFARTLSVRIADIDAGRQTLLDRELRQTMAAWRMEGGATPSAYYVCGAMATREGCEDWIAGLVGAPVAVLPLPEAPGADLAARAAFSRAAALVGRALVRGKRLDVRQGEFVAKQTMTALRQHLPLFASCALVIVASFAFSAYARYSVLEARHQQLEGSLARVMRQAFGVEARSAEQASRLLERGVQSNDPMPRFDAYDALAAISESIPEGVVHDVQRMHIDLGDGEETARFSMQGTVQDPAAPSRIRSALESYRLVRRAGDQEERLACFEELDLGATDRVGESYRYRLEGMIRCRPEGEERPAEGRRGRGGPTKRRN
jgi:Tfp pilus assembly PilM family ATPase